jgi:3-hydroxyacyl-CoA dehydrogenase
MGKLPVLARTGEGFIGNRIFNAYRRQCEFMVEEGATPKEVDDAMVAFGMKMGPFAVSDMAGLDIAWRMRQRLARKRDPRVRYPEAADRLCEMGRFGRKTGAGWYRYRPETRRGEPDPIVDELIVTVAERKGIERRPLSDAEIQARALAAMINEAALLLAEGVAEHPSDVDLVLVNGYGFPAEKGGPLFWAANQPISEIISAIDLMLDASGFGFERGNVEKVLAQLPG